MRNKRAMLRGRYYRLGDFLAIFHISMATFCRLNLATLSTPRMH